jgi:hypothetical protein
MTGNISRPLTFDVLAADECGRGDQQRTKPRDRVCERKISENRVPLDKSFASSSNRWLWWHISVKHLSQSGHNQRHQQ